MFFRKTLFQAGFVALFVFMMTFAAGCGGGGGNIGGVAGGGEEAAVGAAPAIAGGPGGAPGEPIEPGPGEPIEPDADEPVEPDAGDDVVLQDGDDAEPVEPRGRVDVAPIDDRGNVFPLGDRDRLGRPVDDGDDVPPDDGDVPPDDGGIVPPGDGDAFAEDNSLDPIGDAAMRGDLVARSVNYGRLGMAGTHEIVVNEDGGITAFYESTFDAPLDASFEFFVNGNFIREDRIFLPARAFSSYDVPYVFQAPGDYVISFFISPALEEIRENNPNNNRADWNLKVVDGTPRRHAEEGAGRGDLAATRVGFVPDSSNIFAREAAAGEPGMLRGLFANHIRRPFNAAVQLFVDNGPIKEETVFVDRRGDNIPYSIRHSFPRAGQYSLRFRIVPAEGEAVMDTDPDNNEVSDNVLIVDRAYAEVRPDTLHTWDLAAKRIRFFQDGAPTVEPLLERAGLMTLDLSNLFPRPMDIEIRWLVDDAFVRATPAMASLPGDNTVSTPFVFFSPGTYKIEARIRAMDPAAVEEDAQRNNTAWSLIHVRGAEQRLMTVKKAEEKTPHDLIANVPEVREARYVGETAVVRAGQEFRITYTIESKETAESGVYAEVRIDKKGRNKKTIKLENLNIPEKESITGTTNYIRINKTGLYDVILDVDPKSKKNDINTENNKSALKLEVIEGKKRRGYRDDEARAMNALGGLVGSAIAGPSAPDTSASTPSCGGELSPPHDGGESSPSQTTTTTVPSESKTYR